ncbi:MAG: hypothetical protein ACM3SQ_13480 [Betaproteobacteria bacterium]
MKLEENRELTRYACYRDWHRVERALASFELEVSRLTASGWQPDSESRMGGAAVPQSTKR